ncbi:hypothetical protein [Apilactobacillus quenuiae]|nr:hypothetical protein [Apilactobacillus quenuiae]
METIFIDAIKEIFEFICYIIFEVILSSIAEFFKKVYRSIFAR